MKRKNCPVLRWNRVKAHRNVAIDDDSLGISSTDYSWGGCLGTWKMGAGRHFFEMKILRAKLGMGVYIGVAESNYNPQLRGLGMTTVMIPAKVGSIFSLLTAHRSPLTAHP